MNYLTEKGKAYAFQAKVFELFKYYEPTTGCYLFPLLEVKASEVLKKKIHDLLLNGECYDDNGKVDHNKRMGLEILDCTKECIEMDCCGSCATCECKQMVCVRPVERWN